jgi:hypothetical protein
LTRADAALIVLALGVDLAALFGWLRGRAMVSATCTG